MSHEIQLPKFKNSYRRALKIFHFNWLRKGLGTSLINNSPLVLITLVPNETANHILVLILAEHFLDPVIPELCMSKWILICYVKNNTNHICTKPLLKFQKAINISPGEHRLQKRRIITVSLQFSKYIAFPELSCKNSSTVSLLSVSGTCLIIKSVMIV